jgi:hypothetical protein
VGGGNDIEKALGRPHAARLAAAGDLRTYVEVLSERSPENRLKAVLVRRDDGAVIAGGTSWEELPPTATELLTAREGGARSRIRTATMAETGLELDGPVQGIRTARFTVERTAEVRGGE